MPRLFVLGLFAAFAACTSTPPKEDPADLPDWQAGFENDATGTTTGVPPTTTIPPQPLDTEFNVTVPVFVTSPHMFRQWDPVSGDVFAEDACGIDLENVIPGQPVTQHCILEVNEGDLFLQPGVNLKVHVPVDTCDYMFADLYRYQAYEVAYGPTTASYTIDQFGTVSDRVNVDVFGVPQCQYDLTPFGPNCCIGTFTLSITEFETGLVTDHDLTWGGEDMLGHCYDGAAYLYDAVSYKDNCLPDLPYWYTDRTAYDVTLAFTNMNLKEDCNSDSYRETVGLANYVDPADHVDGLPLSLQPDLYDVVNPYYTFVCTDHALERIGVIKVTVREWNTEEEFNIEMATPGTGNHDARESERELVEPGAEGEIWQYYDDLLDWRNFTDLPGLIGNAD